VSNQIERLRYYDGEYLRGYDFTDEQSYHLEMRRRLNHRLHLHGIVYGLHLVQDQDSPPPPQIPFFSIAPGMAIDREGREIFLPAPYSLSPQNVLMRPGLSAGDYELWLCYQETQTGLPSAGYRDCKSKNQNTRWLETFQVVLKPLKPKSGDYIPPDCGGVRLGVVTLGGSNQITQVNDGLLNGHPLRTYVGIRAQRIIAPDDSADTFDITALTPPDTPHSRMLLGYLDIEPGVFNRGNVIVKKNAVVGDDFPLDSTAPNGNNLPNNIPATGNLKVTSDFFLNGDFYAQIGGIWFLLKDYIQTLTPAVVTDVATIDFSTPLPGEVDAVGNITRTTPVSLDSKLPRVSKMQKISVSLNEVLWQSPKDLNHYWPAGPPHNDKAVTISVSGPSVPPAPAPAINFQISATVGPALTIAGKLTLPIANLSVSFFGVFIP
jgi:hypothetical protein